MPANLSVRGRIGDRLSCDVGGCARPVLDQELLAEPIRQPLTYQACDNVGQPPAAKPTMMRTGRVG
jgi:hypothetical protein